MTQQEAERIVREKYPDVWMTFDDELNAGNIYKGYFEQGGFRFPQRLLCSIFSKDKIAEAWISAAEKIKQQSI